MKILLILLAGLWLLPTAAQRPDYAVVNVSVCNTRTAAEYSSGQESQALLGMPVKILDRHHEWTRILTPDHYEAWVLGGCIHPMERQQLSLWNQSPQLVVTALYATVYSRPSRRSQPVSDVVAGNRLLLAGSKGRYYRVEYPDGREGYLPKQDGIPLHKWRSHLSQEPQAILATALRLVGTPYMWGGTSTKGVDCSGFVRTVLFMHDIIIPRNASQQAREGQRITVDADCRNLQPGDLLFFGSTRADGTPRVVHVGFYMGQRRFIHSLGCVRVASLDPSDPLYDAYDHGRLLFASRILPHINQSENMFTTPHSPLYQ